MMENSPTTNPVKNICALVVCFILFCFVCAVVVNRKLEWIDAVIFIIFMVIFPLPALYDYLTT